MPERKRSVKGEIARRLEAARVESTSNSLTEPQVREWTCEYLGRRDDDEDLDRSHPRWNLLMVDGGPEPGFFAALVFHPRPRGMEFVCGTGESYPVRHFCEHDAREDAEGLIEGLRERFTLPNGRLRVNRKDAVEWLGRDW